MLRPVRVRVGAAAGMERAHQTGPDFPVEGERDAATLSHRHLAGYPLLRPDQGECARRAGHLGGGGVCVKGNTPHSNPLSAELVT